MKPRVCYYADHFYYPEGGYLWKFLNWARGLQLNGCDVIWLEGITPGRTSEQIASAVSALRAMLDHDGLGSAISICSTSGDAVPSQNEHGCIPLEQALEADLLLSVGYYRTSQRLVDRFRRSALIDYDPGLLQVWISRAGVTLATYGTYFTIGETVGRAHSLVPEVGVAWHHTVPCVSLRDWVPTPAPQDAVFSTVALDLGKDEPDWEMLVQHGWQLRRASEIIASPEDYQRYIQNSFGEFSCAKPSCTRLQNAWWS